MPYVSAAPAPLQRIHRYAAMQRVTGVLLMLFSLTMLPPLAVNFLYGEDVVQPFLEGLWITLASGAALWWPVRRQHAELKTRDGFLVTVLFWTVIPSFGAIPLYVTASGWHSWTDAVFESVSGFTTTGATTVAAGLDSLPHALNYYRAQISWLGGMGILVLAVAVLPMLGVGGMQLYKAETPGPMKDAKLTPRITGTARALWVIYVLLTTACALGYWWQGMSLFDAICHAMSTLATCGFSTHDQSIGYFDSLGIELVAMVFMLAGASNFSLHYLAWRQRGFSGYAADTEFKAFIGIVVGLSTLLVVPLWLGNVYPEFATALRKGVFHVISYGTTTGFGTADPSPWPSFTPFILLMAMFMMSCAGGTGGGVKVVRLVLFVKQAGRELKRLIHPSAEVPIKLDRKIVPDAVVYAIGGFFSIYIGLTVVLTFIMMATGLDPVTAFSAVAACINNSGPGLGTVNASVASVTDFGKWTLIFAMLVGRLEIFSLLVVFTPGFWRR